MLLKFHENCEKVKKLDTKNKTKHCQKFRISHEIEQVNTDIKVERSAKLRSLKFCNFSTKETKHKFGCRSMFFLTYHLSWFCYHKNHITILSPGFDSCFTLLSLFYFCLSHSCSLFLSLLSHPRYSINTFLNSHATFPQSQPQFFFLGFMTSKFHYISSHNSQC